MPAFSLTLEVFFLQLISFSVYHANRNGGARVVMVIIVGNGHGDTSSNPGRD